MRFLHHLHTGAIRTMGKFKFSYKRFAVTVMVGAILAATTATAAFSYAWFTNHNNVTNNDLHGSTAGAYFARGDGSSANPYVINKPIHLYNLAWLQYIGAFKDASGADKEPYFLIESDLDMTGWTLPPIGTTEHPFKGHLNGNDTEHSHGQTSTAKISNLTVSNDSSDFNKRPSSVTNFVSPEITGLFGVIEKPTTKNVPSVQNLYIDKLTVTSKTSSALTGLVAGRVNGQLEGIGINDSKLNIKDGTSKLDGYDNISKYTSVGYCTSDYETSYVKTNTTMYTPVQVGDLVNFNPTGGSGGQESDWGGSIDMFNLTKRITYIVNDNISWKSYQYFYEPQSNELQSKRFNLGKVRFSKVSSNASVYQIKDVRIGLQNETYLPLNVDLAKEFEGGEITNNVTVGKTSAVAATTSYFQKNAAELVSKNTGYLTVPTKEYDQDQIQFNVLDVNGTNGIVNSLDGSTYDPAKLVLLHCARDTNTNTINLSAIEDGENSANINKFKSATGITNQIDSGTLKKYSEVKQNIGSIINGSLFYNLKWMVSGYSTIPAQGISISGKSYENYNLLAPGIDCFVNSTGYITCLFTPYPNGNSGNKLFSLYKVTRDSNGSNPQLTIIDDVPNNVGFDSMKAILYMEIPVEKGEYFITSPQSGNSSTYAGLMYLDIGANAGGTSGNKVNRTKIYEVFEQVNEEFKYPNGVEIVNFAEAGVDAKKFAVVVGASYSGEVKLNYTGSDNASVDVTESNDTGLGYFEAGLNITGATTQVGGTTTQTRTQRLTYFDYYRETALGTEAHHTNVLQFSQTQTAENGSWGTTWGETVRSDYRSGEGDTTFTKYDGVGGLTIFTDDGKSTTKLPTITAPESYDYNSRVFTLQTTDPTVQSINADWIQTGSYPTPYVFKVSGYKFTMNYMKNGTSTALTDKQYSISIKDTNYKDKVSINGNALPKA